MKYTVLFVMLFVVAVFLSAVGGSVAEDTQTTAGMNVIALNTGSMQIKGVTWCKKYFDKCVLSEDWIGPIMQSRQTVTSDQYVTIQTGVTNPTITEFVEIAGGKYQITFVYDQTKEHERWDVTTPK